MIIPLKIKIIAADADKIAAALNGLSNNMFMSFVNGSAVTSARLPRQGNRRGYIWPSPMAVYVSLARKTQQK